MKNKIEIIPFNFCIPGIPAEVSFFILLVILPIVVLDYVCKYIPGYTGMFGNADLYMHPDGVARPYPPR